MAVMISRFAPAPTGFLHLGHVVNAIYVWGVTRARGGRAGRVLLRIEDHDRRRSRKEFEAEILDDLGWLGFQADAPAVRQSERDDIYLQALDTLHAQGVVYACACSRAEIAAAQAGLKACTTRAEVTCTQTAAVVQAFRPAPESDVVQAFRPAPESAVVQAFRPAPE